MKRALPIPAVAVTPRPLTKSITVQKCMSYLFGALLGMLVVGHAGAQAIVGAWSGDNTTKEGAAAFVFLANGSFYYIENVAKSEAPGGFPGFERGTYTWNPTTGAIAFNTVQDLNGNTGIGGANGRSDLQLIISGDTGTFIVPGGDGKSSAMRVTGASPIVGAWSYGNPAIADDSGVVVFLPNGVYFMAEDGDSTVATGDPSGHDGIEHGTYAWNPATGALTSSRTPAPYVDTTGDWGLSNPGPNTTFKVSADGLTLTLTEGTTTFSLARVGAARFANSATFTVTNTNDSGAGSLRDAIAQANAAAGADTIIFSVTGTILLTSGQIRIDGPLTIVGPGADTLAIDGNANGRIFTIYENNAPACPALSGPSDFPVKISGLTLKNASRNVVDSSGGAIVAGKSLALDAVIIRDSVAKNGGGLAFFAQYPGQSLRITNSQFINNMAKDAVPGNGGGHNGGGLYVAENCPAARTSAVVAIATSVFSGNRVQPGALSGAGGAIATSSYADITITDSRIVDNHLDVPSPPIAGKTYFGGGIQGTAKSLAIVQSEVANNTAGSANLDNTGGIGGGLALYNDAADRQAPDSAMDFLLVNSTVSGNVANQTGGAMNLIANVAAHLANSTVSGNAGASTRTGGIQIQTAAGTRPTLELRSSIVANSLNNSVDIGMSPKLVSPATYTIDSGTSLVGNPDPGVVLSGTGNFVGVDPRLGPLAHNDGTTRTHALLVGSPAINGGSNPRNTMTDQRGIGFPRVVSGTADMGALESNPVSAGSAYSRDYVQKAYVAYYGRSADPGGRTYWATRMDAEGGSLNAIIGAFGYSDEFNRRYGGLSYTQLVTKIYQQALGRDPDQGGLDWYVAELVAGRRTLQSITLDVMNGATTAPDSTVVANKLDVAAYYSAKVAAGCPYGTEQQGVNALAPVTADPVTAAGAEVAIGSRCAP